MVRACVAGMSLGDFVRIEHDDGGPKRHRVVHFVDPKFSIELAPDTDAPDKIGRGVLKRLCVPNSWAGDYDKYAKLVGAAQEFFQKSFAKPEPAQALKRVGRRG